MENLGAEIMSFDELPLLFNLEYAVDHMALFVFLENSHNDSHRRGKAENSGGSTSQP